MVALAVLSAAAFVYPFAIYPLILRCLPSRPLRHGPAPATASLLFCAYNEAACLPDKIANLRTLKARAPGLQILVYDDSSSDGSGAMLAEASDLLTVVTGPGRTGKAAGMKQLVARATGEVLIFTDANILLDEALVDHLLPYYGDPQVGGVAGTIRTTARDGGAIGRLGSTYVAWDDRLQLLETRTGNVMGASGGLFSVRRSLYPDFPDTVQDDFAVSMAVVFAGFRLIKAADVLAYEDSVADRPDEWRRRVRIGARALHTHRVMAPQRARMHRLDRFKYASRKEMRWMGGLFLALAALFALVAAALIDPRLFAGLAVAGAALLAGALSLQRGLLARVGALLVSTYATFYGALLGITGRTMPTWTPAKSR